MQDFTKVAPSLQGVLVTVFIFLQSGAAMRNENEYEPYSAVTFLLLGLGIGTVLALVCNPKMRQRVGPEGINGRRAPAVQPQEEATERVA
jgi:hypothetical protein